MMENFAWNFSVRQLSGLTAVRSDSGRIRQQSANACRMVVFQNWKTFDSTDPSPKVRRKSIGKLSEGRKKTKDWETLNIWTYSSSNILRWKFVVLIFFRMNYLVTSCLFVFWYKWNFFGFRRLCCRIDRGYGNKNGTKTHIGHLFEKSVTFIVAYLSIFFV